MLQTIEKVAIGVALAAAAIPLSGVKPAAAQEPAQIIINTRADDVPPRVVDVPPGTTVLWKIESDQLVKFNFTPKAVSTICRAPRGFTGTAEGIDHSVALGFGDIASVCLIDPDEYHYEVQFEPTAEQASVDAAEDVENADGPQAVPPPIEGLIRVGYSR